MPVEEAPVQSGGSTRQSPSRRGRRRRRLVAALAVVVVASLAATARLFVWPDQGMPPKVSALVSLEHPGGTLGAALSMARQHRAPFLVISLGTPESGYGCPRPIAGVRVICFNPSPGTTQGEAEFVGRLAKVPLALGRRGRRYSPGHARPATDRTLFRGSRVRCADPDRPDLLAVSDRLRVGGSLQGSGRAARLLNDPKRPTMTPLGERTDSSTETTRSCCAAVTSAKSGRLGTYQPSAASDLTTMGPCSPTTALGRRGPRSCLRLG